MSRFLHLIGRTVPAVVYLLVALDAYAEAPGNTCANQAHNAAETLERLRQSQAVPAMGLSIFCDGQPVIVEGYGNATADTPFRWGSITKSVTGLAALRLVQQSDLTLASPIRPILGDGYYQNPWAETHPIRLGHLLALSAGLPDLSRAEWNDNEPRSLWQALTRHEADRIVLWPSGLQHSYSNVPPGLTAAVIERTSGRSFEVYVEQHLFEPLGMANASLSPVDGLPGGFKADGQTEIPYWHMTYQAFGALNASTREMSRLLAALLNEGQLAGEAVLEAGLVSAFFQPMGTLGSNAGLEVGYGAGVYGWVRRGQVFHGHGGDADGYRSRYGLLLDTGRAYLLVINKDDPGLLSDMRRLLEDALTQDLSGRPRPAGSQVSTAELDDLAGDYYPASARFNRGDWQSGERAIVRVRRSGRVLVFERSGQPLKLYPAGQGRFFRNNDPAITVIFTRGHAESLHLQGELGNFVRISPGPCPDFLPFCD